MKAEDNMENATPEQLQTAARGAVLHTAQKGHNMIAVASGKGGVGKTWFSGSVISGGLTLNQVVISSEKGRFDVIAGRSGSAGLASMPIGRLQILGEDLSLLSSNYDKVILDMGAGVEKPVRILSGLAEQIIVICTEEPTSLTDAYAYIKIMTMQYPGCRINIVVNQVNSEREGQRTYDTLLKACRNFLNITPPLLGIIRRDTRVRDSIRNQAPLISRYPTSEAAEDVIRIARRLLQEQ